jgi:hypothetical protein
VGVGGLVLAFTEVGLYLDDAAGERCAARFPPYEDESDEVGGDLEAGALEEVSL